MESKDDMIDNVRRILLKNSPIVYYESVAEEIVEYLLKEINGDEWYGRRKRKISVYVYYN